MNNFLKAPIVRRLLYIWPMRIAFPCSKPYNENSNVIYITSVKTPREWHQDERLFKDPCLWNDFPDHPGGPVRDF